MDVFLSHYFEVSLSLKHLKTVRCPENSKANILITSSEVKYPCRQHQLSCQTLWLSWALKTYGDTQGKTKMSATLQDYT